MLDLDYIKKTTIWMVKFENGHRIKGTYDELSKYRNDEDVDDLDTVCWEAQPKELQEFYKDYEYAVYKLNRKDLYLFDDFYAEWVKNPSQFKPGKHPVINKLSEILETIDPCDDIIINNYDGSTAGNHKAGNFVEALQIVEVDFDVITYYESSGKDYDYTKITVQTDDLDTFRKFDFQANRMAMIHDKFLGDGKYSRD